MTDTRKKVAYYIIAGVIALLLCFVALKVNAPPAMLTARLGMALKLALTVTSLVRLRKMHVSPLQSACAVPLLRLGVPVSS